MSISRRIFLSGSAAGAAIAVGGRARSAVADDYPVKPILLVVGNAAGGSGDISARILAEALTGRLGQAVVVENKTGASATIAIDYVARSRPDGYTLSATSGSATSMLAAVKPKTVPFDLSKDLTFIARQVEQNYMLVVNTKWPFKTLAEFVDYAKANPGKLRCGNIGFGSTTHMTALLFEQQSGVRMTYVPYRGGMATMPDMLAGNIDCAFLTVLDVLSAGNTDKITELVISADKREPLLPNVPTMAEAGYPNAVENSWNGIIGPSNLPPNVVEQLTAAITDAMKDPAVQDKYLKLGMRPAVLAGDAFRQDVVRERDVWKSVVEFAHMTS
jgi:tripartite-type tricarboxylate transporter receptor subunit TctC